MKKEGDFTNTDNNNNDINFNKIIRVYNIGDTAAGLLSSNKYVYTITQSRGRVTDRRQAGLRCDTGTRQLQPGVFDHTRSERRFKRVHRGSGVVTVTRKTYTVIARKKIASTRYQTRRRAHYNEETRNRSSSTDSFVPARSSNRRGCAKIRNDRRRQK